jgi:hypothetical protein
LKPAAQTCSVAAVGEHVALALSVMEILSILKLKPAAQTCSAAAVGEHVALALSVMEILSILKLKPAAQTCSAAAVGEHVALALSVMEILGNTKVEARCSDLFCCGCWRACCSGSFCNGNPWQSKITCLVICML